ncbi:MAG: glycosyltransferase family 9 protein [Chlamydiia bacterium]|nr:glycosyltransferase family 9 protein [Chlamydiia bacterium]
MKNFWIRLFLRFFSQKNRSGPPRRILVVATTALGDTLWATPALASLRQSFPEAYIAVVTSGVGMELLKHNPNVDRLYEWKNLWRLYKQWKGKAFDTALIFHASQRLPLPLCVAAGIGQIVGTAGLNKGLDDLLTLPLPNIRQHEIERRLAMVKAIGGKVHNHRLSLFLTKEEKRNVKPLYIADRWVAIHPGSKDVFKRWPLSSFAEVGNRLQKEYECQILITGTQEERDLMAQLAAKIPGSRILEQGLSLRQFAAVLEKMALLISNDTGPVHVALALERPVIAIYASTDPELCGPYQVQRAEVVARRATCMPCLKRKCQVPFCLMQIGPEEVIAKAAPYLVI